MGFVECVPNFSEGRRTEILTRITDAARVPGVAVLGMSSDEDHNRSVLTLAGEAENVLEAAYQAARVAVGEINLRQHRGTHPRMGAVDVIPFIPLGDTPMVDCVQLAEALGQRLGNDGVPVYLYEAAARSPERRDLANVRHGEFEGLAQRMREETGRPDYGPAQPHPTAGAVAIGARNPLIAYNVYLNTQEMRVARMVARRVRGSSGGLRGVKALPMNTRKQGMVQVSMNLVNYPETSVASALEMVRREAERFGVQVVGSEFVGFVPQAALIDAAAYYLQVHHALHDVVLEDAIRRNLPRFTG